MTKLLCLGLLATGLVIAQEMPVMPYDSLMEDRVSVDGWVEREDGEFEYPAELKNPATGMTVSWGYDDSLVYVAVETRGKGWFGFGLGSATMAGSYFWLGFYDDDSVELYNLVGVGHGHELAGHADSLAYDWDVDFDDETGVRCLEVVFPLRWSDEGTSGGDNAVLKKAAIPGLEPGDIYDMVLAQNTRTASLDAGHTHRA
ncbi:hypothetical protein JXB37_03790, partial [candidate division WOR-3 bacterium]|nr:hypothetical protein [candidate division WOR-3 bacterium]